MANPRVPTAAGVSRQGLGLAVTTQLPTRQPDRRRPRAYQVVPIAWRPEGPDRVFRDAPPEQGQGATSPCEDC